MERVRVGIATIENRVDVLEKTIDSLYNQADEICVNLNGWSYVPNFLKRRKIIVNQTDNLGDLQKFTFLDGFEGYYLTCDDDILYGPQYVEEIVAGIERYNRKVVVGWHGSILKRPFVDYYTRESRDVFTFRSRIPADKQMDILGTGCMGFHTDTIRPAMEVFLRPSMADVYFALFARRNQVPLVLLGHDANVLTPQKTSSSISDDSIAKKRSALNVRERVNSLAKVFMTETPAEFSAHPKPRDISVAMVGRTDTARWLKGGIRKSAILMEEMLKSIGYSVNLFEIEAPISETCSEIYKGPYDAVLVYTGDQKAQDFYAVNPIVETALGAGKVVIVNLSIDLDTNRTSEIVDFLNSHGSHPNLKILTFSQGTENLPECRAIRSHLITVPKSLEHMPPLKEMPFATRSGVFLGDLGKLANPRLTPQAISFLQALKQALPNVNLDCVTQYATADVDPEIRQLVNVIPYQNDIGSKFLEYRLYVHLFYRCTFEMLPVEAMSSGLPVIYRDMPHALNEYIGLNGLRFKTAHELSVYANYAYYNESAWRQLSQGGRLRGGANSRSYLAARMGAEIALCVDLNQETET